MGDVDSHAMNSPILRGSAQVLLPALLIWPATAPWADTNPNFNPKVTATTPDIDFTLDDTHSTAYHKKTGLTWKRCAEGQSWSSGACTGSESYYTWV